MPVSVNVISPAYGFGYQADIELVSTVLEQSGFAVTRTPQFDLRKSHRARAFARTMAGRWRRFDINIFLAYIFPEWLPLARKNVLVPNVEDLPPHYHKYLRHFDLVVAKTRLTEGAFRDRGFPAEYTGFTSRDHFDPAVPRDHTKFFHACSSEFKGTKALLEFWGRHPEYPELVTTINHNPHVPDQLAPNVRALRGPMPLPEVRRIRNSYGFHLCPSEAEGFGHYIAESMACRAVVFTTDGAPMNEMIQPDRGVLLETLPEHPARGFALRYFFRPESLEAAVERALRMDRAEIDGIGDRARTHFLESDKFFRKRLPEVIRAVAP